MKTIFVTLFQGVEAKNILRTDIYKKLVNEQYIKLIFFVGTSEKASYYNREFSNSQVTYEIIFPPRETAWDRFLGFLKFKLVRTRTLNLRRRMALEDSGKYFSYIASALVNVFLANFLIRKLMRFIDYLVISRREWFCEYFDKYKPDLVFLSHVFDDREVFILAEAKRRNILTVGFINSWDKLTSRGMIRITPDKLIVFNDIVKAEALRYTDVKTSDVFVSGLPQYDMYFDFRPSPKDYFYGKLGIAEPKRIIVYAPMGKYFSGSDWDIIDLLYKFKKNGCLPEDVEVLVRFQPNDFVDESEIKKRPWLKCDIPGIRFSSKRGVDWDMSFADLKHLADTLYYASVFICYATSLSIDAAIFDKPVININFEVKKKQRLSKTPTFFYKTEHYINAAKSGGIKFVNNPQELLIWINKYLEDSSIDRIGREKLVKEQCNFTDGKSGKRIADFLINKIRSKI